MKQYRVDNGVAKGCGHCSDTPIRAYDDAHAISIFLQRYQNWTTGPGKPGWKLLRLGTLVARQPIGGERIE